MEVIRKCRIKGMMRNPRQQGSVLLEWSGGMWVQTGFEEARHLCCAYTKRGTDLNTVLQEWLPFDFAEFEVEVLGDDLGPLDDILGLHV